MSSIIGLIASCVAFVGLAYSIYRNRVLEKRLEEYERRENADGKSV